MEASGLPPSAPQRTHWYANESGVSPAHVPTLAARTRPWASVPEIDGSAVFRGAPVVVDCVTASVGLAVAVAVPAPFDAVTCTRSRFPMSALVGV